MESSATSPDAIPPLQPIDLSSGNAVTTNTENTEHSL